VVITIETSLGTITAELNEKQAPVTVANFLAYVDGKHYDGTIFHRVIKDFMIQGGGFSTKMVQKPTQAPIKNEAGNGLANDRGTLAMARTGVVDSATCQFFINHRNNDFLNHQDETPRGFGYCVFGKVVGGMDVVDKIAAVVTSGKSGPMQDMPLQPVEIKSIRRQEA
jgi:cyclophilin family peptidyl-prolyl cis-trans isomerase